MFCKTMRNLKGFACIYKIYQGLVYIVFFSGETIKGDVEKR
jgi:hypothetical protein